MSTKLSPDDVELFRHSVGPVRHIKTDKYVVTRPPPVKPYPKQRKLNEQAVIDELLEGDIDISEFETGDELLYLSSPTHRNTFRKLRKGLFSIQGKLDLHGLTVPMAKIALVTFLNYCIQTDLRCVLIIHGKGHGSHQRKPILKGKINAWLQNRQEILAFCSARQVDGGTGAIYVLLKNTHST